MPTRPRLASPILFAGGAIVGIAVTFALTPRWSTGGGQPAPQPAAARPQHASAGAPPRAVAVTAPAPVAPASHPQAKLAEAPASTATRGGAVVESQRQAIAAPVQHAAPEAARTQMAAGAAREPTPSAPPSSQVESEVIVVYAAPEKLASAPRKASTPNSSPLPTSAPVAAGQGELPSVTFASPTILYRAPGAPRELAIVAAAPTAFTVVSVPSFGIALVEARVDGQMMVSPYQTGQRLPNGERVVSADPATGVVKTNVREIHARQRAPG